MYLNALRAFEAAKWLLPRIDRFQSAYPDTDVRLDTSLKLIDFIAQGVDIGVRYGRGEWPGLAAADGSRRPDIDSRSVG